MAIVEFCRLSIQSISKYHKAMNPKYLIITIIFFMTETLIALFVHDSFVRPFFGDFLVVILMYSFFRIYTSNIIKTAFFCLSIAYFIEMLQYFKFIEITGLIKYTVLAIVIGNSFAWGAILAYTLGILAILIFEYSFLLRFLLPSYFKSTKP